RVAIVWRSFDGRATHLRAWVSDDGGARFALKELAQTTAPADNPLLLQRRTPAGVQWFVLWNTQGEIHVQPL
ncbi:MAG: hypothetical protein WBG17_11165, partial [Burkholderiaceae bacterium]